MGKTCEICGKPLTNERHVCKDCQKAKKREHVKQYYQQLKDQGIIRKHYGSTNCCICGKEIIKNRKDQDICFDCYKILHHKTVEDYNKVSRSKKANTIGRQTILDLGFQLNRNLCIHHLDENPENNKLSNLIIINRKNHACLHRFLEKQWSLLSKDNNSNLENCWNSLRDRLTTTWMETSGVNVIKIIDIGRSAAEPLNEDNIYIFIEEGSETMYQTPKEIIHGEDIVQTQTSV